jgi:hypothetical protein
MFVDALHKFVSDACRSSFLDMSLIRKFCWRRWWWSENDDILPLVVACYDATFLPFSFSPFSCVNNELLLSRNDCCVKGFSWN